MKSIRAQIKALTHELEEKKAEFGANVQALQTEMAKPGMLFKGFLVGFAIGFLVLSAAKKSRSTLPQPGKKSAISHIRPHLIGALAASPNRLLASAAQILKFL